MKPLFSKAWLIIVVVIFVVTGCEEPSQETSWGWKRATAPDDVMNFLNKKPPYTQNIKRAEITAVNKGTYIDFIIFYQTGEDNNDIGWGWKKSTNEDDVKAFLSGEGSYSQPIVLAEVVAVSMPTHTEFYIFYTR